ncbi:ATP-binding cassette domain-containing protein [Cohnella herbarum]|uniref:ATP-binding cassette domain-containing protein n=1 Tax=Cohnella herbarum TaxID=2728023 RepID=A0A7Z2VL54_9BACL|nr:ATP-binding cassette domain-containing protein [Cohnella herbarum]QJD85092.1 ATP-binding cassette domain-containing protein [Cohnella herbarum]
MTQPLIKLDEIVCRYGSKEVLKRLSLTVCDCEVTAIVGSNGSGKSTLLKMISGYGQFNQGSRKEVTALKKLSIGFVPDGFPRMRFTAEEYLRSMGKMRGMANESLERRIAELLLQFGLNVTSRQQLRHYSKGMLQKVNLMQALLEEPDLLLLDEPLSGLDIQTQDELIGVLLLLKKKGMAIVLSTHEREVIDRIADRVVTLKDGVVGNDYRIARQKPVSQKMITFDLDEEQTRKCMEKFSTIIVRSHANHRWSIEIDSSLSDRFLQAILNEGASVVSVENDEMAVKPYGQTKQGVAI